VGLRDRIFARPYQPPGVVANGVGTGSTHDPGSLGPTAAVRDQKRRFVLTPHQFYLPPVPSPLRGGEPWLSLFDPAELSDMLRDTGFLIVEDLGLAESRTASTGR
jgi:hypothetical protein